jgi:branched-chain amino acid transport system ATP-binding protein
LAPTLVEQNATTLHLGDRAYLLETRQLVRSGTGAKLLASPDVRDAYPG